jgi:hypothetical protein
MNESAENERFTRVFVATPSAIRRARSFVVGVLELWNLERLSDDAAVITTICARQLAV